MFGCGESIQSPTVGAERNNTNEPIYIYIRQTHRQRKQIYGYKWGTKWGEWGLRETTTIHKIHKQQGTIFSSL